MAPVIYLRMTTVGNQRIDNDVAVLIVRMSGRDVVFDHISDLVGNYADNFVQFFEYRHLS